MYSIVIIEDDLTYLSMIQLILQMEGFDVRSASDAQSGFHLIRERRPDVILCDIMMPEMDGHSVLHALQEDDTLADIPFVFVTALGERDQVRRGMSAGADDYLPKPFSAEELIAAVIGRIRRHERFRAQRNSGFMREEKILKTETTKREREVLLLVGRGLTSKEIASRLGVSPKTVEVHRANLMRKLEVTNAAELARWAFIAEAIAEDLP